MVDRRLEYRTDLGLNVTEIAGGGGLQLSSGGLRGEGLQRIWIDAQDWGALAKGWPDL